MAEVRAASAGRRLRDAWAAGPVLLPGVFCPLVARLAERRGFKAVYLSGAALSATGRSVPSRAMRTVWLASPTTVPSRSARSAGFSAGWRVCSLTIRKTVLSGVPAACASSQPVKFSATALRKVTRPAISVVMTASPMLASVTSRIPCWS